MMELTVGGRGDFEKSAENLFTKDHSRSSSILYILIFTGKKQLVIAFDIHYNLCVNKVLLNNQNQRLKKATPSSR